MSLSSWLAKTSSGADAEQQLSSAHQNQRTDGQRGRRPWSHVSMFEASNVNQQILGRVGPLSGSFTLFSRVGVSIETIARAAQAVGKRVTFQLFDAESRG